jgi:hypothetical protein
VGETSAGGQVRHAVALADSTVQGTADILQVAQKQAAEGKVVRLEQERTREDNTGGWTGVDFSLAQADRAAAAADTQGAEWTVCQAHTWAAWRGGRVPMEFLELGGGGNWNAEGGRVHPPILFAGNTVHCTAECLQVA